MVYEPQEWQDDESGGTPIIAASLNHMESGIAQAGADADAALSAARDAASGLETKADASHTHQATDIASGVLPVSRGGTGQASLQAARNALGLGNTIGALPVANGGTGAATLAAAKTNLGIGDVAKVSKSFSIESGHLTGTVTYYMKNGIVFVGGGVSRVAGGSIANGEKSTGITLPANMRPSSTIRSCEFCPTNNENIPAVGFIIYNTGAVNVWYSSSYAPPSGATWNYSGWVSYSVGA